MAKSYTAKDITVLEGLEPVRRRPGMYIGGVGPAGLHHLVWEVLDNAVDEAMNGHATRIGVTLHADGTSVTVSDDGRGIPVDTHKKTRKSALEVIFTTLHAGGKFEHRTYRTAGGEAGMKHFLEQFGPCLQWPWTKLTDVPDLDDALIDRIVEQSDAQAAGRSVSELEEERDANLVAMLKALRREDTAAGAFLNRLGAASA